MTDLWFRVNRRNDEKKFNKFVFFNFVEGGLFFRYWITFLMFSFFYLLNYYNFHSEIGIITDWFFWIVSPYLLFWTCFTRVIFSLHLGTSFSSFVFSLEKCGKRQVSSPSNLCLLALSNYFARRENVLMHPRSRCTTNRVSTPWVPTSILVISREKCDLRAKLVEQF